IRIFFDLSNGSICSKMLRQILTLSVFAFALDSTIAKVCLSNGLCYEGIYPSLKPKVCSGRHEHWSRYGGCDKNCLDLLGNSPCPKVGFEKCLCDDGYVRRNKDGTGPCIPPSQCPHRCPKHQHWSKNAGCKCDKGYVRRNKDGTGPCIPPSQCPHRCPKHQHWSKNVGCEKTCHNLSNSRPCSLLLKAGCKCDKGYVRRNKDGTGPCIPPSQCPHRCPKHEHWTRDKGCEKTCGNLGGNRNCPLILTSGCTCNRHFVRKHPDGTGPCIPPSQCPHHRCPKHEHWTRDKGCEKTCGNLDGNRNCPLILTAGCTCNRHLVRKYLDGTGPCIPPSQCPHRRCPGKHEKWDKCRGHCQPTCRHKHPMCDLLCRPGCICEDGYVRKNSHGPCIRKRDCWRK
ncbi:hypothetical protein SSS_09653, partial [Sarcoptes scabiei]